MIGSSEDLDGLGLPFFMLQLVTAKVVAWLPSTLMERSGGGYLRLVSHLQDAAKLLLARLCAQKWKHGRTHRNPSLLLTVRRPPWPLLESDGRVRSVHFLWVDHITWQRQPIAI